MRRVSFLSRDPYQIYRGDATGPRIRGGGSCCGCTDRREREELGIHWLKNHSRRTAGPAAARPPAPASGFGWLTRRPRDSRGAERGLRGSRASPRTLHPSFSSGLDVVPQGRNFLPWSRPPADARRPRQQDPACRLPGAGEAEGLGEHRENGKTTEAWKRLGSALLPKGSREKPLLRARRGRAG